MQSYENILKNNHVFRDEEILSAVYTMAQLPDVAGSDWREYALCRVMDPELFDDSIRSDPRIELARRACDICSVTDQCLEFALASSDHSQVYGGLTGDQRRAVIRKTSRANRTRNR